MIADRWYPSSKACHACGHVQDIGWVEHWTCNGCGAGHQRDDNAAVNLARYAPPGAGDSAVGPVRAAVKRRADLRPGPARPVAKKRGREPATTLGNNPETGCRRDEHYCSLISNES